MNPSRRGGFVRALGLVMCALLLTGCASVDTAGRVLPPRVLSVSPDVVQQGKPATLTLQVDQWTPGTQLALMPAGPYLTHRLSTRAPRALAAGAQQAYVATVDGQLLIIDFPEGRSIARVLGRLALAAPARQLVYSSGHLLALLEDGRLQWLDVSRPGQATVLATVPSPGKVRALQLDADAAYLLLEGDADTRRLQRWIFPDDADLHLDRQWTLAVAARDFAVRDGHVWTVGPGGIAVLDIRAGQAVLSDTWATSGSADDVQLQGPLALVSDGRGGLVVFDVSEAAHLQWRGSFNKRGAVRGIAVGEQSALLNLQNGTLLRLGLGNPELPSSGAAFRPGVPVLASVLQGDAALLLTPQGLQRVMMVGGGDGAISPEGLNLGGSRRGTIRGDILYVADWFSGLHLYDISQPRQLHHLGNYHTPGSSKGVALLGDYALVGDDDQGLQIIDIKNPRQPRWVSELPPEAMARLGLAYTMKRVGKTLYLADHRGGFHIIDLSDIRHPRRLGGYDTPGKAWDIDVRDKVAFVADDRGGLLMFDVSDPAHPEPFAQFNPGGQAEAVALQDGRAYVAFFDQGLYVLDVRDPHDARVLGHTPIPGNARGLALGDGLIYVASWEAGLQIVDIREARAPHIIGQFDTDGAAWGVKVKADYAYVLDWWGGIKILDISRPERPTYVGQYQAHGTLQQLRSKDTYLYAASGVGGLQVYDIKNPLNPIWVTGVDVAGQAQGLWLEDDRAYLAAGKGGVFIFDTLDPFYTRQIGHLHTPGEATGVVAGNEYLYIADRQAGLLVMDVRDAQRPVEVARYPVAVRDMWLDEQTLWLLDASGLAGWQLAEDGRLRRTVRVAGEFVAVRAQDDVLAAATRAGIVKLWRRTAKGVKALGQFASGDAISGLQLVGNSLYVLGLHDGLQVVDVRRPTAPRLVAAYPATGRHTQLAIARGAAFFAGENKLASLTLLPAVAVKKDDTARSGELFLQLPEGLPRGRYHLLMVGPMGQRQLVPDAFTVQFAAPGKKKFTLDVFRRLLKAPLKPPVESEMALPSSGASPR